MINKYLPALFALGLAACGTSSNNSNESASSGCQSDSDCPGTQICLEEKCEDLKITERDAGNGYDTDAGQTDAGNPNYHCGNSPIYGKHLWEIKECDYGMYGQEDCSVKAKHNDGRWETGQYQSLTVTILNKITSGNQSSDITIEFVLNRDRSKRFNPEEFDVSKREYIEKVNGLLNSHQGYVMYAVWVNNNGNITNENTPGAEETFKFNKDSLAFIISEEDYSTALRCREYVNLTP